MSQGCQSMRNSRCFKPVALPSTLPVKKKSDRDKENVLLTSSGFKQRVRERSLSELKSNRDKKRNKHNSVSATKESEKVDVRQESVGMKEKKMTGHLFKSQYKKGHTKRNVSDIDAELEGLDKQSHDKAAPSSDKIVKLDGGCPRTNMTTFSEAKASPQRKLIRLQFKQSRKRDTSPRKSDIDNADVAKKRKLVMIENVEPSSVIGGSERDTRGAEERNEEDIRSDAINANMNKKENSTNEEQNEEGVLLNKKQAKKDKTSGSGIDYKIYEVQKECKKRMKKLIRKQQEEIREFHRVWDDKKSKLELDHKLQSAFIRSIFREESARSGRLKELDDKFAETMGENNLLKETKLKDLEEEQLSAVDTEKRKAAHWMARVKAFSSGELTAVDGLPAGTSSMPMKENDVKPFNSDAPIGTTSNLVSTNQPEHLTTEERVLDETRSVELNQELQLEAPEIVISEISDYVNPVELINALVNQRDGTDKNPCGDGLCLDRQILLSKQTKGSPHQQNDVDKDSSERSVLAASGNKVPDVMRSVKLNEAVPLEVLETVSDEIVDMTDVLMDQRDGTNDTATGVLSLARQISEPSEQTEDAPNHCDVLLLQVPEDPFHQSLSDEPQDGEAKVVEKQNDLLYKVAASESIDTPTSIIQSNTELQNQDSPVIESRSTAKAEAALLDLIDTVTPVQSNADAQAFEAESRIREVGSTAQTEAALLDLIDIVTPVQSNADAQAFEAESQIREVGRISSQTTEGAVNELQDQGANLVVNQNDMRYKVAASEHIDTSTILTQSNTEHGNQDAPAIESQRTLPIEGPPLDLIDTVNPEPSTMLDQDALVVEDEVTMQNVATNLTLLDAVIPVQFNVDAQVNEVVPHESASRPIENFEIQTDHLDVGSLRTVSHETSIELPAFSHNNLAISRAVVDTFDILNQGDLPLEIDLGPLHGSNHLFPHPSHRVASLNSAYRTVGPLDIELEKNRQVTEQLDKNHQEMMSQMKTDCENELREIVEQIHKKYEVKRQDAEVEFSSKKNELEKNRTIVLMNKILAEAFSSDLLSFDLPSMHQGAQYSSMQYNPVRPPSVAPPSTYLPTQTAQAMQHSSLPQLTRLSPHHFQYFPPAAAAPPVPFSNWQSQPVSFSNWPSMSHYPPQQLLAETYAPSTSRYRPQHQWSQFVVAPDRLRDVDDRTRFTGNRFFSCIGNVQGSNQPSSGLPVDAVCLSDDD